MLRLRPRTATGTTCLTVGCGHDFDSIRVGVPLAPSAPAPSFGKIVASVSSAWGDGFNPEGGHTPVTLPFVSAFDPAHRKAPEEPATELSGDNPFSEVPVWAWTKWTPLASASPDPKTGARVLMLRAHASESGDVVFANGKFEGYRGCPDVNKGFDCWIGGVNNGWDLTDFRKFDAEQLLVNYPVNGTPLARVQFRTKVSGIVGMATGDSHQSGTATPSQVNGFLLQATTALGSELVGQIPFGLANDAFGGARSEEFFARTLAHIGDIAPSYVVLPGWCFNDYYDTAIDCREVAGVFLGRLNVMAKIVEESGATPIYLTPFPRDQQNMSASMLSSWLALRRDILSRRQLGAWVIDATAILGQLTNGQYDGTYRYALSDDHIHPNSHGHFLIAQELIKLIKFRVDL